MSPKATLKLTNIAFDYGNGPVISNINLEMESAESISLIGPSGAGKTTLLGLLTGDLIPTSGKIEKHGLWRRVFQSRSLLPWLTVEENILLGTRNVDPSRCLDFKMITDLLNLGPVLKFYPRELSGGLGQRTEIARALIGRPDGLLLDEPFSSLDYLIRHETRNYLAGLLKQFPITMVLVTHDIPEAVSFTQKSYVLNGRPATIVKCYKNNEHDGLVEKIWQDLK